MSDDHDDDPVNPDLAHLLEDPTVWAEPSVGLEDQLVAAIAAERVAVADGGHSELAGPDPAGPDPAAEAGTVDGGPGTDAVAEQAADPGDEAVVDLGERRAGRAGNRRRFWPLAAAAGLLIVALSAAAGFAVGRGSDDVGDLITVALAPTDVDPDAAAIARIDERPNGARLLVELSGLAPAPSGFFYEVWLVKEEPRTVISAGTFHMRGSDQGEIEFWAGVSPQVYRTVTVTLESEADPSAPGELVLIGEVEAS